MSKDIENGGVENGTTEKENKGMSQSLKEDIHVYVTILLVILLGLVITLIKVGLLDMNPDGKYSSLFGSDQGEGTISPLLNATTSPDSA